MHHAFGIGLAVYLVSYAFGQTTARVVVGTVLIAGVLAFAYVSFRIVTGTI